MMFLLDNELETELKRNSHKLNFALKSLSEPSNTANGVWKQMMTMMSLRVQC
jgi:hypothetical protein